MKKKWKFLQLLSNKHILSFKDSNYENSKGILSRTTLTLNLHLWNFSENVHFTLAKLPGLSLECISVHCNLSCLQGSKQGFAKFTFNFLVFSVLMISNVMLIAVWNGLLCIYFSFTLYYIIVYTNDPCPCECSAGVLSFTINCENKVAFLLCLNFYLLVETFNEIEPVKVRKS